MVSNSLPFKETAVEDEPELILTDLEREELIEKIAVQMELERRKATDDYYAYVRYTNIGFVGVPFQEMICNEIDKLIKNREKMLLGELPIKNQYLMLSVPPRHGKSATITETLPSYFLGKFPNERVIVASYSETFATKFGSRNKQKIEQFGGDLFGIKLSKTSSASSDFDIEGTRGGMISRGIMGGITGMGASLFIIDDPVRNRETADSLVIRDKIWDEWNDSLHSRKEPPAIYIVIMTRWHEDDLAGRLVNPEYGIPLPWQKIVIPLQAEDEDDILGREIGEVLWDRMLPREEADRLKVSAPQTYNSLYQGRPSSKEGNLFKRDEWKYYVKRDEFIRTLPMIALSIDAAFTDTKDRVSIQVWGKKGADYFAIDNVTALMDFNSTIAAIRTMLAKYPMIHAKYVENRANGAAIINVLNKDIGGFIPIQASSATGGKEARASAAHPYVASGNVYLPQDEPWVHDFVEELASFPNGKYKDQVDAFSQLISQWAGTNTINVKKRYNVVEAFYGESSDEDEYCGFGESFEKFGGELD